MTAPWRAVTTDTGRFYPRNGLEYISVTTALSAVAKGDGLVQWAANQAYDAAYDRRDQLGMNGVRDMVRYAWKAARDEAARIGDETHSHAEYLICNQDSDMDAYALAIEDRKVRNRVKQFIKWLRAYDVQPIYVEATVYSDSYLYAGSCDLMAWVDGVLMVIDFKTSKSVYGSVALQTAAYAHADYILTDDGEQLDLPNFTMGAVLHIKDRSYKFLEVDVSPDTFKHFLNVLTLKRDWLNKDELAALMNPILPKE